MSIFYNFSIVQMPNDVELPPTVSNLSYLLEDDALDGPLKVCSNGSCPKTESRYLSKLLPTELPLGTFPTILY